MEATLQEMAAKALAEGPDRVMISEHEALGSKRARELHGTVPDVVFLRGDGWSLGAPKELEYAAYRTWPDQWVGFMICPETAARPISEYGAAIEAGKGTKDE